MTLGFNNQTYADLVVAFLPRRIYSEADYQNTQAQINVLIDKGDLSQDELDYLYLLGSLIMDYEDRTEPKEQYDLTGIPLVKGLIELHDLRQQDLVPIFKTKSIVSAVLNGKRKLTVEHIDKLAQFFNLPHEVFFERVSAEGMTI